MQQGMAQPPQMFNQQQGQQPQRPSDQQKMMYQMRLQQQLQQQNMMSAQRQQMGPNPLAKGQMQGPNGQFAGMRPQQPAQPRPNPQPEQFMKSLVAFMQSKNLPLDMNPIVGDRQIALVSLYMAVLKFGGFKKVTQQNGWSQVAMALHFQPMQHPTAAQQLKTHYERNLLLFDDAFQQNQFMQRQRMMQQQAAGNMPGPGQMSPTKQMNPQAMQQSQHLMQQQQMMAQQHNLQQQHSQSTPVKQMHHAQQPAINGFSTPQHPQAQHSVGPQSHSRNSLSRSMDGGTPQNGSAFTMPSPMSATKPNNLSLSSPQADGLVETAPSAALQDFKLSEVFDPKVRVLDTHGGVQIESLNKLGASIEQLRPDMPQVPEMGIIDIHALTMSIQSGITAEVRMALDMLAKLTTETRLQFILDNCEDLMETLIDCAEVQVDLLAENAAEVSDVMLITSYEDIVRACRSEQEIVQDIPIFGSSDYELDRAVDRLICITTILRNLGFLEANQKVLCNEVVIKFLCVVIRHLGTRNMLLRTHQNALDFMKDVVIFLSCVSHEVALPGREQALCLLHFLLAFAPCPLPNNVPGSDRVTFTSYDPAIHRYLPAALDSLAKLLARDEPNRTHYKTIFASDIASTPPYDLLTRTFALSISPIPSSTSDPKRASLAPKIEARKPFLMQGMLAADILSSLAPGFESGVAKSWLESEDGFARNLARLIQTICHETSPHVPQQRAQAIPKGVEDEALLNVTMSAISVLRRLGEKCRDPEDPKTTFRGEGFIKKDILLGIMEIRQPRLQGVVKGLCGFLDA
jgi:SWI/SNF chromatin-remodeling complex subunit SWI1